MSFLEVSNKHDNVKARQYVFGQANQILYVLLLFANETGIRGFQSLDYHKILCNTPSSFPLYKINTIDIKHFDC